MCYVYVNNMDILGTWKNIFKQKSEYHLSYVRLLYCLEYMYMSTDIHRSVYGMALPMLM